MISVRSPPIEIRRVLSILSSAWAAGEKARNEAASGRAMRPRSMDVVLDEPRLWFGIVISFGLRRYAGRLGQAFDDIAPVGAFRGSFVALAEELDDHFAVGAVDLDGGDVAILGRLAHGPGLGDVVLAQMQVEGLVEDVDPRAHRLDVEDRAGVDLDDTVIADKAHDRQARLDRSVHHL